MLFNGTDTGAPLKHALLSYNISHGLSIHIFEKIVMSIIVASIPNFFVSIICFIYQSI